MTAPTVVLRPVRPTDIDFLAEMATDPQITRFVGDGTPWQPTYLQQRLERALAATPAEQEGATRWFIGLEDGEPVALTVAVRRSSGVELGYWVAVPMWGQGIAGAAVRLLLDEVRTHFGAAPVFARVHPGNAASVAVLSGLGWRPGGSDPDGDDPEGVVRYEPA